MVHRQNNKKMNILEEALKITQEDRQNLYGKPKDNFEHIAKISSAILKETITAKQIVMIMFATKLSREMHTSKRDNHVDLAGYSWVLNQVMEKK